MTDAVQRRRVLYVSVAVLVLVAGGFIALIATDGFGSRADASAGDNSTSGDPSLIQSVRSGRPLITGVEVQAYITEFWIRGNAISSQIFEAGRKAIPAGFVDGYHRSAANMKSGWKRGWQKFKTALGF